MKKEVMLSSSLRGEQMRSLREAAKAGIAEARLAVSACEPWPALTIGALDASLNMVRRADYYLLVVAGRYGSRASDSDERSFTEVEFDEAIVAQRERGLKRLAFFEEPMTMETTFGSAEEQTDQFFQLLRFREKVKNSGILPISFRSPDDLRREVGRALLTDLLEDGEFDREGEDSNKAREKFHAVHEYLLLDTALAGRKAQTADLSRWANASEPILVVESFGGFGKSALTWWWWEQQKAAAGWSKGFWFSFFELSSTVHEFFSQLYSHLADKPIEFSRARSNEDLARDTLKLSRENRYLIVLDGFERTLNIANGIDANADRPDTDGSSDTVTPSLGSQTSGVRSIQSKLLADWLVRVANSSTARILLTTRYRPSDLENVAGRPRRGVDEMNLQGFSATEAKEYWELIGLDPGDRGLERLVTGVHGHPLSLEVMAGTLRTSESRSLADFFERKPDFPVFGQEVRRRDGRDDVFEDALENLSHKALVLLQHIALWPLPVPLNDLKALMRRSEFGHAGDQFADTAEFVEALLGLEERRLISRNAGNVDMHPVMRSVVRERTSAQAREAAHGQVVDAFSKRFFYLDAQRIEDVASEIQLVVSATKIDRWDVAIETYAYRVRPQLKRLNYRRIRTELLAEFFLLEEDDGEFSATWKRPVPYVKTSVQEARVDAHLIRKGVPSDCLLQFKARQDFAQDAAGCHESLGKYKLAAAFYHEHNRTCADPFCRTAQTECFEQQGLFGYAANILTECLADLDVDRIRPREKNRLASILFWDCIDRDEVGSARIALARRFKVLRAWPSARMSESSEEEFRSLNLALAKLAENENAPDVAVAIARDALESARADGHSRDQLTAMRSLAKALRSNAEFREAAEIYDDVLALDPDRDDYAGLWDRANRARNQISLLEFGRAAEELEEVIERAGSTAYSTHAVALIYRSELDRALNDEQKERTSLRQALDIYLKHRGTPSNGWDVRTCVTRLRAINAIDDLNSRLSRLGPPIIWPESLLKGHDEASVTKDDEGFLLEAIWRLD